MTLRFPRLVPLAAVLAIAACNSPSPGATASKKTSAAAPKVDGPVVARVGDKVITAAEVEAKLAQQSSFMQARYSDLKYRKDFVDNLVRFELLAQAAYERGLDKTPKIEETIKKILVQEFIRDSFDEKNADYSDEQLKAFYEKHIKDFVKPERVRASHIFFAAAQDDAAARAAAKKKAADLLSQLKANAARAPLSHPQHAQYKPTLFAQLAGEHSDDQASRSRRGDLAYLSHEDLARAWSTELADAVFALGQPNDLTGVVETPKGFHIASFGSRTQAVNRKFEDPGVKDTVQGRLFREERTKSFDAFVEELRKKADVTIDEKVLAELDVSGATVSPVGAPPPAQQPRFNPPPVPPVAGTPEQK